MSSSQAPSADRSIEPFGEHEPAVIAASALILALAVSVIDKLTGYDLQIGVLHAVPVALVTWTLGRAAGVAFTVLAVALWLVMFRHAIDLRASLYFYWDAAVLAGTLLAFVLLIGRLRDARRFPDLACLDELPAPAYVVAEDGSVLYANAAFRDTLAERGAGELERYPAIESRVRWRDARRARLRILTL